MYLPFAERQASAAQVVEQAAQALAQDAQNNDALVARCFVAPPFGRFVEAEDFLERLRQAPGSGDGRATSAGCFA